MTQTILDLVSQHEPTAFALVFFVSLGEALFLVGLFVPSTVVLVAAGTLVGAGKLPFLPILALASAGAIVGDALSFWIGHHYQDRLRSVWPFSRYAALLARGEAFFQRHGGKSIFIGRFVPGVKAIVPGNAGMAGMNFAWFSLVNIFSAIVWAGAHIIPAAGIGIGLARVHNFDPRLAILAGVAVAIVVLAIYFGKLAYGFAYPVFNEWRVERIATRSFAQGRLARFETRFLQDDRGIVGSTLVLVVALVAGAGFLTLLADYLFDPQLKLADKAVYNFLQSLRSEAGTRVMTALTMGADGFVLTALAAALLAVLVLRRRFALAITAGLAIGAQSVFVPLVKAVIQRPRPTDLYSGAESFSFPSGHATQSMTVFGVLAVITAANVASRWRPLVILAAVTAAAMVSFTRLYLGAHWLSDVSAGFCFGLLLTALFAFVSRRQDKAIGLFPLMGVLVPVTALAYAYHLNRDYDRWVGNYAPALTVEQIEPDEWMSSGWQKLARTRLAVDGDPGEPLFVQAGLSQAEITARLAASGWSPAPVGTLVATLFPSSLPLAERATAPLLHEGLKPVAAFVRADGLTDDRSVLRFWRSAYTLGPGLDGRPILLGGLSREILEPLFAGYAVLDVDEAGDGLAEEAQSVIQDLSPNSAVANNDATILLPLAGEPEIVPNPTMRKRP